MPKIEFVCTACGFRAFVDRLNVLLMGGWLLEKHGDGATTLRCPACLADERPATLTFKSAGSKSA